MGDGHDNPEHTRRPDCPHDRRIAVGDAPCTEGQMRTGRLENQKSHHGLSAGVSCRKHQTHRNTFTLIRFYVFMLLWLYEKNAEEPHEINGLRKNRGTLISLTIPHYSKKSPPPDSQILLYLRSIRSTQFHRTASLCTRLRFSLLCQYLGQLRKAEGGLSGVNTAQASDLVENLGE